MKQGVTVSVVPSSKKGDLEFIESIMVVIVVVVLLSIGLVMYYKISSANIESAGKRISDTEASVLISTIDSMPEIQCSLRGVPKDCVDVVKLQAFKKFAETKREVYVDNLGFKVVRFEQIYPLPDKTSLLVNNGECTTNAFQSPEYPDNCANWTVYSNPKPRYESKDILRIPVSLFQPITKKYAVGILSMEVYS